MVEQRCNGWASKAQRLHTAARLDARRSMFSTPETHQEVRRDERAPESDGFVVVLHSVVNQLINQNGRHVRQLLS